MKPKELKMEVDISDMDIPFEEDILQHLARSITGKKGLTLSIKNTKFGTYTDMDTGEIVIQKDIVEADSKEELKRFWKALNCHESAHVSWSGNLRREYKNWDKEDGDFANYKDVVNVIEDVRIEEIMTKVLPQTKRYFVEHLRKFMKKRGEIGSDGKLRLQTDNPMMALRFELETKVELPYEIDKAAHPYIEKAVKKFEEYDILNGNWKDVVKCAYEIHLIFEELRKKHPEKFMGGLGKKLKELMDLEDEMRDLDKDFEELRDKNSEISDELDDLTKEMGELDKEIEELDGKETGGDGLTSEEQKEIEDLKKKKDGLTKKKEKLEKREKEIKDKIDENKDKYREKRTKRDKAEKEFERAKKDKTKEKVIEGLIRITDFEDRESSGEFSEKDADEIIEEMKKVRLDDKEEEEKTTVYDELKRKGYEPAEVKTFDDSHSEFIDEGNCKTLEPELAFEMGDEIASALKRELNLKSSLIKRKTSGKLDMHRIRKQYTYYGKIRDTDIFLRRRKQDADHSVLVLTDFSGSMYGRKIRTAKQALTTLARTLAQLRVNHSLRGFCAETSRNIIADVEMKEFSKEEADYKLIDRAYYPYGAWAQNRDGDSIRYAGELLAKQSGDKLLIVISDGQPHHGGTTYYGLDAEEDTILAVEQVEAMGIKTIGISIDASANDYIDKAYRNSFFFDGDKLGELSEGLTEIYLEAMHK